MNTHLHVREHTFRGEGLVTLVDYMNFTPNGKLGKHGELSRGRRWRLASMKHIRNAAMAAVTAMAEEEGREQNCCCDAVATCLFCCFAHVAILHPHTLALLQASPFHLPPAASSSIAHVPLRPADVAYSYSHLLAATHALATRLRTTLSSLPQPPLDAHHTLTKVAILIPPSVPYVVSVLAVLQCGAAFVPLDPFWPAKRVLAIVGDSNPCLLITCEPHHIPSSTLNVDTLPSSLKVPILSLNPGFAKIYEQCQARNDANCPCFCHSKIERPYCYLMYTSGSTGKPKGVCGTERGLLHRLEWMQKSYPFLASDVALFKTSVGFVDHLTELFGPLLAHTPVVISPPGTLFRNPLGILPFLQAYNVSRLTAVPSLMRALLPVLQSSNECPALNSLRILVLSGEVLFFWLLKSLHSVLPQTTILNLYGSTELSGDCMYFDCGELSQKDSSKPLQSVEAVPIGKPIPGCCILISSNGSDVTEEGELWVGGALLALGYLNDILSTGQKFVSSTSSPAAGDPGYRHIGCMFRTGDYVKKLDNGNCVFLGRKDRMFKINGQRIALEEIESNLEMHPLVAQAAVIVQSGACCDQSMVAYVVLKVQQQVSSSNGADQELTSNFEVLANAGKDTMSDLEASLKSWLIERLPLGMVPNAISFLPALPMVDSGKVDYLSLSETRLCGSHVAPFEQEEPEQTALACYIKEVFQHVLGIKRISTYDDFFSLGGTSVSAAHAAHILNIDMPSLYRYSTAMALEPVLTARQEGASRSTTSYVGRELVNLRKRKHMENNRFFSRMDLSNCRVVENQDDVVFSYDHRHLNTVILNSNQRQAGRLICSSVLIPSHPHFPSEWPYMSITESTALLRCNKRTHMGLLSSNTESWKPHTIFLASAVLNTSCDITTLWRISLKACIDASPVLVQSSNTWHLLIGSHAHSFVSVDAISGELRWETVLGGRVESTAAITADFTQVAVGCYDGFLYFMDRKTGILRWKFHTHGEVKCQPTLDVRTGLIWFGSHDHNLYVLNTADHKCVWQYDCQGTVFAPPAHDCTQRLTYVATTGGILIAVKSEDLYSKVAWKHTFAAPIFGSPIIDHSTGYVICCLVNGDVFALTSNGLLVWNYTTLGPIFAGASVTLFLPSQVLICSRDGFIYSLNSNNGLCIWKHCLGEPITSAAFVDEGLDLVYRENRNSTVYFHSFRLVCACGSSGQLHVLKVYAGSTSFLSPSSISSLGDKSAVEDSVAQVESLEGKRHAEPDVMIKYFCEDIKVIDTGAISEAVCTYCAAYEGCELVAMLKLPGDVFSSPIMLGGRIFLGCRDNNLYCLELSGLDL